MKRRLGLNPLRIFSWLFVFLACVAVGSVLFYQQTGLKVHFFHESTYPLLYAESNNQNQALFSETFSGREISPISWTPVGSVLLYLFGGKTSLSVHVMYAVSFTLTFLSVCLAYVRLQKFSLYSSAAFITLIFTVVSSVPSRYGQLDQVWIWPMNSYGVQDLFALVCVLLVSPLLRDALDPTIRFGKVRKALTSVSFLVFLVFAFNGTRGALMIGGGIIFGLLLETYFARTHFESMNRWKVLTLTGLLSTATVIGLMIYSAFSRDIPQPFQTPHTLATLSSADDLMTRIGQYFWGWLKLFDAVPDVGSKLLSFENSLVLLKAAVAVSILVMFFRKLRSATSLSSPVERILTYRTLFIFLVTLSAAIFGDAAGLERYLIPLYFCILFLVPFWLEALIENRKFIELSVASIVIGLLALGSVGQLTKFTPDMYKETDLYGLASHLKNQHLGFGFVTPWDSDGMVINQYSEGDVRVQPVDIDDSGLIQHIHSNSLMFESSAYPKEVSLFLAIPLTHASELKDIGNLAGPYLSKETWKSWLILTYPKDQLISAIRKVK